MKLRYGLLPIVIMVWFKFSLLAQMAPIVETPYSGTCGFIYITDKFTEEILENTRRQNPQLYQQMVQNNRVAAPQSVTEDTIGTIRDFYVINFIYNVYQKYTARLMAKGRYVQIWADTLEIFLGEVTQGVADTMLNALENETPAGSRDPSKGIVQLELEYFGDPPNYDGDNLIDFLLVNILDSALFTGVAISGYFNPRDQTTQPGSNQRDILYIDIYEGMKDSNGKRNPEKSLPTVAHELQHLIHYNYDQDEATFVNEGLSEVAEVICGFKLRDPGHYFSQTDVPLFDWNNISRKVIADYSRAALFTFYYDEQFGDSVLKRVVQNPLNEKAGLDSAFLSISDGLPLEDLLSNWFSANIVQDRSISTVLGYRRRLGKYPQYAHFHTNPNVQVTDQVHPYAVDYIGFTYAENFEITFQSTGDNVFIDVIKIGNPIDIEHILPGETYLPTNIGLYYTGLVFVVYNLGSQQADYEYTARGEVPKWIVYNTENSRITSNRVTAIAIDKSGNKWLGTRGGGVLRFDGANWHDESRLDFISSISDVAIDQKNTVWVTERSDGLIRINGTEWFRFGSSRRRLTSVAVSHAGAVWVGYDGNGLASFDGTRWQEYKRDSDWHWYTTGNSGIPSDRVYDVAVEPNSSTVWVGTATGLAAFDGTTWSVFNTSNSPLPDNAINVIAIDDSNHKWIGTSNGLAKFDGSQWTVYTHENSGLSSNYIQDIAFDDSGNVWIATTTWDRYGLGGLVKFNRTTNTWTVYRTENSGLPTNDLLSVAIDAEGNRWIGTTTEGLVLFCKGDVITSIEFQDTPVLPDRFALYPNFPNPFNPVTTFAFDLPKRTHVQLTIYDVLGRKVATAVDNMLNPGHYEIPFDASHLASGIYFFQLRAGQYRAMRKMMLLK